MSGQISAIEHESRNRDIVSSDWQNAVRKVEGQKTVKEFNVVIEKDEDGYFVASAPALPGSPASSVTPTAGALWFPSIATRA